MKKFDLNQPVILTRKDYVILCGYLFGTPMVIYGVIMAVFYWDDIQTWVKGKIKKIKSKLPWCK